MIRAVIFDLDGTLADTATVTTGRRDPWHVLAPGFNGAKDWSWSAEVSDLPGQLIARGYHVGVATRAPAAYASTLLHLIGADSQWILAACGPDLAKAERITQKLPEIGCRPDEVLYIGDIAEDREIARQAGIEYADVAKVFDGTLLKSLPAVQPSPRRDSASGGDPPPFASGRFQTDAGTIKAIDTAEQIADSIHRGIPDVVSHGLMLDQIFQHPEITNTDRAALCYFTLLHHPGGPLRRTLQHGLLAGADASNNNCLVTRDELMFQIRPELLSKMELRSDPDLLRRCLQSLNRVFPAAEGSLPVSGFNVPIRVIQTYKVGFGDILRTTKDYGGRFGSRFRSGPNVHLGHLDLIAAMTAATLDPSVFTPIVNVPPSPATAAQPGELSLRLAHEVARLSHRKLRPALLRAGDELSLDSSAAPGEVVLVEDQVTHGTTLERSLELLVEAGYQVREAVSFSANDRFLQRIGAQPHQPMGTCGFSLVARWLGCHCPCGRTF